MSPSDAHLRKSDDPLPFMTISTAPLAAVLIALVAVWASATPNPQHTVGLTIATGVLGFSPPEQPRAIHTLAIAANGALAWDGQAVPDRAALNARLRAVGEMSAAEQREVHVKPHPDADYGAVVAVLAVAQRNGVWFVGINGEGFYAGPAPYFSE